MPPRTKRPLARMKNRRIRRRIGHALYRADPARSPLPSNLFSSTDTCHADSRRAEVAGCGNSYVTDTPVFICINRRVCLDSAALWAGLGELAWRTFLGSRALGLPWSGTSDPEADYRHHRLEEESTGLGARAATFRVAQVRPVRLTLRNPPGPGRLGTAERSTAPHRHPWQQHR